VGQKGAPDFQASPPFLHNWDGRLAAGDASISHHEVAAPCPRCGRSPGDWPCSDLAGARLPRLQERPQAADGGHPPRQSPRVWLRPPGLLGVLLLWLPAPRGQRPRRAHGLWPRLAHRWAPPQARPAGLTLPGGAGQDTTAGCLNSSSTVSTAGPRSVSNGAGHAPVQAATASPSGTPSRWGSCSSRCTRGGARGCW
jgi:hypothetical protein